MKQAYLDNSATTAVCKQAADKAYEMMTGCYGNPSSLHTVGFAAEQELTAARRAVAKLLGCPPDTLIFTSGGTEANNLAILGGWAARKRRGGHAVTTAVEHPSVAAAFDALEKEGAQVDRLVPDEQGRLTAEQIAAACREDTILVSVMLVNNETGARFPVEEAAPLIRRRAPQALIHCDAVQAAGKIPVFPEKMGVDALSVSGHKLHAPKGVGALYLRKGVRVVPRALGGGQEKGLRSGTEPVPLIAAFGAAAAALPPLRGSAAALRGAARSAAPRTRRTGRHPVPSARGRGSLHCASFRSRPAQRNAAAFSRRAGGVRIQRLRLFQGAQKPRADRHGAAVPGNRQRPAPEFLL